MIIYDKGGNMIQTMNFMKIEKGVFKHRQIERRQDRIFMRAKKRPFIVVREV